MEVDFLLIGQGIAGTVLSYRLIRAGSRVMVIDQPDENRSSRVAAGLYNPITGRKMVKTWYADRLFPEIEPTYRELERWTGLTFLHPKAIYRPFFSIEEQNEWMGKSSEEEMAAYLREVKTRPFHAEVNNPYGGILLKNCGYLDINKLLDGGAAKLKESGCLREEKLQSELMERADGWWHYKGIKARKLVYCNGLGAMESVFFDWLPFAPVKGEILEIESDFVPAEIINRGVFRISLPDGKVRAGSTYSWHDLDIGPTERAKTELLEKLEKLVPGHHGNIYSHRTGIRPATKDRKPMLGKHPTAEDVYIFNGFGAKGVSLVPYFSKKMLDLLLGIDEAEKDVNISRFFKYI